MLQHAASINCWQLASGETRMLPLSSGIFVEGDIGHYGEAAAAFIARALPVFGVPWRLKVALEEAGIACRTLTPAILRCLFQQSLEVLSVALYTQARSSKQERQAFRMLINGSARWRVLELLNVAYTNRQERLAKREGYFACAIRHQITDELWNNALQSIAAELASRWRS